MSRAPAREHRWVFLVPVGSIMGFFTAMALVAPDRDFLLSAMGGMVGLFSGIVLWSRAPYRSLLGAAAVAYLPPFLTAAVLTLGHIAPVFFSMLIVLAVHSVSVACAPTRRARPGCCTQCGYDLAGLAPGAPCPECGKAAGTLKA